MSDSRELITCVWSCLESGPASPMVHFYEDADAEVVIRGCPLGLIGEEQLLRLNVLREIVTLFL